MVICLMIYRGKQIVSDLILSFLIDLVLNPKKTPKINKSKFRDSEPNHTRLDSMTHNSQREKLTNPHMGDTMYVNLLADESFDLDVNIEEIDNDEYNPEIEQHFGQPYIKQFKDGAFDYSKDSDSEDKNSRLAKFAMMNLDSRR